MAEAADENSLIQINYPGSGNNSLFTFDGLGHNVKIVETVSSSATTTKQFIWCNDRVCEATDATGLLMSRYFLLGETIGSNSYCYSLDHLGGITTLANFSGGIGASFIYDAFGRATSIQGAVASDFQYAGYYFHAPSGLNITVNRAYKASLGKWINRDPANEGAGVNLYGYVKNNPINFNDPSGLCDCPAGPGGQACTGPQPPPNSCYPCTVSGTYWNPAPTSTTCFKDGNGSEYYYRPAVWPDPCHWSPTGGDSQAPTRRGPHGEPLPPRQR